MVTLLAAFDVAVAALASYLTVFFLYQKDFTLRQKLAWVVIFTILCFMAGSLFEVAYASIIAWGMVQMVSRLP